MDELKRQEDGTFAPGHIRRGGRRPGSINRFTRLREDFIDTYYQNGGAEKLRKLMEDNPRDYFRILAALLPKLKVEESRSMALSVKDMTMTELIEAAGLFEDKHQKEETPLLEDHDP